MNQILINFNIQIIYLSSYLYFIFIINQLNLIFILQLNFLYLDLMNQLKLIRYHN